VRISSWSALLVSLPFLAFAQWEPYEETPIRYSDRRALDVVWELNRELAGGAALLDRSSPRQFLQTLLDELEVPKESQMLVFSQTSFQNLQISGETPRALYFNEDHYVGWVQGGEVELATVDPRLGMTFYQIEVPEAGSDGPLQANRNPACLVCHAGNKQAPFPGLVAHSVFADEDGTQALRGRSLRVDQRTPVADRWGGWYVTGTTGGERHRGNIYFSHQDESKDRDLGRDHGDITELINGKPYLHDESDVLTLLVFEHQLFVHNAMLEAFGNTRIALYADDGYMVGEPISPDTEAVIAAETQRVVDALLFREEASLKGEEVVGSSAFREAFSANAKQDKKGRSLKDFQLEDRIFRYRCSYMIYSRTFEYLPDHLKEAVFEKLDEVLTAAEAPDLYQHLGSHERRAIHEILRGTHPGFAEWLRKSEEQG